MGNQNLNKLRSLDIGGRFGVRGLGNKCEERRTQKAWVSRLRRGSHGYSKHLEHPLGYCMLKHAFACCTQQKVRELSAKSVRKLFKESSGGSKRTRHHKLSKRRGMVAAATLNPVPSNPARITGGLFKKFLVEEGPL